MAHAGPEASSARQNGGWIRSTPRRRPCCHGSMEKERAYFTDHQGCRILVLDLSRLSAEATPACLQQLRQIVAKQPPVKNVLLLVNVKGNRFNEESVEEMKRVSRANEPWVLATAMVGMSKLGSIIARQVYRSAGRTYEAFDDVDAAKDWLVQQAPKKS